MNAITRPAIFEPGIRDMDAETYHADPTPTPSLSAGMINDLLVAPAKAFANSRRLNPEWEEPEGAERFSIGSVAHVMFLEPHLFDEKVAVIAADDWRTKDAKAQRDAAKAAGKTPVLEKHADRVWEARKAFLAHPFVSQAFTGGRYEQSMFWKHPSYGFWCRARPDFLADGGTHINDYKATADANPERFGKHAAAMGYHRRAAWYLEGAEILLGKRPKHYWYVNQETRAPYLTSVIELDINAIEAGRAENERAAQLFDRCLQTGDWFGYRHRDDWSRDLAFQVSLPSWALMQIEERIG